MNVYIDNLKLTDKPGTAIRVEIKARYTPTRVRVLNAKLKAAESK